MEAAPHHAPGSGLAATDFAAAARSNRRNTWMLIGVMIAVVAMMGYLAGATIDIYSGDDAVDPLNSTGGIVGAAVMAAVAAGWTVIALAWGDRVVLSLAGARTVEASEAPVLHNVVEEMAIAAGVPKPRVAVIDSAALNAFATGMSPTRSAVAVTKGLLATLSRDELQAVVGHEMGHVVNFDIRYGTAVGILAGLVVLVADASRRGMRFGGLAGQRRRADGGGVLLVIFLVFAILAPLVGRLVQMAISRQREYLADATAVRLTRNPLALISALEKLGRSSVRYRDANRAIQHLYIVNPFRDFATTAGALMATHPPLAARIARLRDLKG